MGSDAADGVGATMDESGTALALLVVAESVPLPDNVFIATPTPMASTTVAANADATMALLPVRGAATCEVCVSGAPVAAASSVALAT